jgi:hypothetical protein
MRILAIAVLALSLAACGVGGHTVMGSVTLNGSNDRNPNCSGTSGYDDLKQGTSVVLHDAKGTIVGTAPLSAGTPTATTCLFNFTMSDVAESPFYTVNIGSRGGPTYQLADFEANGWTLNLSIGDGT